MLLDNENVFGQHGGTRVNDLNEKLALYDEDANEVSTISHSPYMTHNMIPGYLSDHQDSFSVMSRNCQSINAKLGQLEALLSDLQCSNFMLSVICLQETWLTTNSPTADISNLPGYKTISFGSSAGNHGGLIFYIRDEFKFKVKTVNIASKLWECQFPEISDGLLPQPIILGSIYRPPRNNNDNSTIRNFTYELSTVLNEFTKLNYNIIITGDFNINLLEINELECYGEFIDMMISNEENAEQKSALLTNISVHSNI